eukprot:Pompholyxophrys_punicea_v1_NODE_72_length_3753_cov_12.732558.p3 type:complete len:108 gc:universal NODE_72_length_3753_cov_12.732558:1117-794(-)
MFMVICRLKVIVRGQKTIFEFGNYTNNKIIRRTRQKPTTTKRNQIFSQTHSVSVTLECCVSLLMGSVNGNCRKLRCGFWNCKISLQKFLVNGRRKSLQISNMDRQPS